MVGPVVTRGLVLKWLLGFGLMFGAMGVVLNIWKAESIALAVAFVESLGGPGVSLAFFVPDAIPVPIPHDLFSAAGMVGGLGFWEIVAFAHVGSITGGCVGFAIGRRLAHTAWFRSVMAGRGAKADQIVRRYGDVGILVGALTPLPYSLVCWAGGALGMGWVRFLLVSQVRVLRIAAYLWAIETGILEPFILPED